MSKENDSSSPVLQPKLQPDAPFAPTGQSYAPMAAVALEPVNAPTRPTEEPTGQPGEPDTQTAPQWCKRCKAQVIPVGKGRCPRCNAFLRLNFTARRHPINVLRKDALLGQLLQQFPPTNIIDRSNSEQLAVVLEQLETMRPGTADWQRLVTVAQTLATALRDAHAPTRTSRDYGGMSVSQLAARAEQLLRVVREAVHDAEPGHSNDAAAPESVGVEPIDTRVTAPRRRPTPSRDSQ